MSIASDDSGQSGQSVYIKPPAHPVPTLQGPFEESMVESVDNGADFDVPIDAISRRTMLLEGPVYERIIAGRWRQKPGEKYHPIWKLVAQMTFGLHLLARGLAKSEDEVMKILQNHVDDIDHVLERTAEDFDLAHSDMHERLRCLKLPLQHGEVFDRMLEDRSFRASILDGNEKIEHIVSRTRRALKDSLKDVQKGFDATNVLDTYVNGLSKTWQRESPEHEAVHVAMLGNVEGWKRAFMDLHLQGNKVGGTLKKLMEIVSEMEKRAAMVSRNQLAMSQASMASIMPGVGSRNSAKPLPVAPGQRMSTRNSSRSTNTLRDFSSPFSNESQDRSSNGSQSRTQSGRQTPIDALPRALHASKDSADDSELMQKTPTMAQTRFEDGPVELPADVPTETLRQAPVSKNNRLSYTLGLQPRDYSEHRISSIYYPKALGDLLKIQHTPPVIKSPQVGAVMQTSPHSATSDYFSAHIRGSSITLVPINASKAHSNVTTPEKINPSSAERSPVIGSAQDVDTESQTAVVSSPGLNFHPSVMDMATPPSAPVELPAANENVRRNSEAYRRARESRSSIGLLSNLGEPGPEVANSAFDGEEAVPIDLPTFKIDEPDSAKRAKFISGLDLPETVTTSLAQMADTPTTTSFNVQAPESNPTETEADVFHTPLEQPPAPAVVGEPAVQGPAKEKGILSNGPDADVSAQADCETPRQKDFVAELEAHVPVETTNANDLVEMEAPVKHFVLPPRDSAIAIKIAPPPAIKQRTNLLKARALAAEKEAAKQPEVAVPVTATIAPLKPLKLRLAKKNGKMVAVEADSPGVDESERPEARSVRLSTDIIANMIDQMSDTPATSPTVTQSSSQDSPQTAQGQFGPPNSAPVPPPPGGRAMVNPDYARAGALEGERKTKPTASERHSAGKVSGISGLKDLISNATSRRHSSEVVHKGKRPSLSTQPATAQLLDTTNGSDVLWFKGHSNGKEKPGVAVGVS